MPKMKLVLTEELQSPVESYFHIRIISLLFPGGE